MQVESLLYRGADLLQHGDTGGAETAWHEAAQISPADPNIYKALGRLYIAQGRLRDASAASNRLADCAPNEPHALCELALIELRTGEPDMIDAAARDATRAAEIEPNCIQAQTVAGDANIQKGDTRIGIEYLKRAVRLNPSDVPLRIHLIQSLLESIRMPEAEQVAIELTHRYPGFAQGYALLGFIYSGFPPNSPQVRAIPELLNKALTIDPTNSLAHAQLGHYLVITGKPVEAIRYLKAARFLNPPKTSTLFDLARAYRSSGQSSEAVAADREFRRRSKLENEISVLEKHYVLTPQQPGLLDKLIAMATELGDSARVATYRRHASRELRASGTDLKAPGGEPK